MLALLSRLIGLFLAALTAAVVVSYFRRAESPVPVAAPVDVSRADLAAPKPPPPAPRSVADVAPAPRRREPANMVIPPPPPAPAPEPVEKIADIPALGDSEFYALRAPAIVQIYCQGREEIFAASGVVVSESGLVLTNAHVAESVRDIGAEHCQARHGNPADPFARVEVVFIASTTPKIIKTNVPQRDLAFLRLVEAKEPFARAPLSLAIAETGETLRTLGYPSEFLQSITTSAHSTLTFSSLHVAGYADLDGDPTTAEGYVFRGGLALQQGSSGTAVFGGNGDVLGLIFATTRAASTAEREGIALLTPYIDSVLRAETGQGIQEFIESH